MAVKGLNWFVSLSYFPVLFFRRRQMCFFEHFCILFSFVDLNSCINLYENLTFNSTLPCIKSLFTALKHVDFMFHNKHCYRLLYPVLQHLDLTRIQLVCTTGHVAEEPYTTENLAKIHGGYKILTNITELLRLSFCNLCVSLVFWNLVKK